MLPTVIYIQKYKYTKIQECDTCLNMEHTEHTEHTENTALNLDFTVYEFSVNKDGKFTTIKIIQDNNSSGSGSGNDSGIGGDSNGSDSDSSGSSGSDSDSSSSNNVSSGNSSIISNNSTFNYNEYLKTVDLTSINIINICCILDKNNEYKKDITKDIRPFMHYISEKELYNVLWDHILLHLNITDEHAIYISINDDDLTEKIYYIDDLKGKIFRI